MDSRELRELYVMAAARARVKPQHTEEAEWKKDFQYADARDLETAIQRFFQHAVGSVKGIWMPKVNELAPMVEQAQRARESRASAGKSLVAWKCPVCHLGFSGFLSSGESQMRKCARCTSQLEVVHWEVAA